MTDDETMAQIRADFEVFNFDYDDHSAAHMAEGRFDIYDVVSAVRNGDIIEDQTDRGRLLFCGRVQRLRQDRRYHDGWVHVIVQHEEGARAAMVTAYRPTITLWRTERIRR